MPENSLPVQTNAVPMVAEELETDELDVPPPPYGDHHHQLQFSRSGFAADASVNNNGRVNIYISEKNRRLTELLAPSFKREHHARITQPHPSSPVTGEPLPPPYIPPSLGGQPGQIPPPRLNVVIQIVGSRGDVQPFVALGQVLRDTYGHRVRLATHATFKDFVEENGLEFFNIGGDPAQLMAFMVKNPGLVPGFEAIKSGDIKRRRKEIEEILMGCWRSCIEAGDGMGPPPEKGEDGKVIIPEGKRPFVADAIIANPPSFAHIHIAEKLGIPLHMMFTMPWTPTKTFPHPLADIVASTNTDSATSNYVSYALVEMLTWQGLGDVINRFRTKVLELEPVSLLGAPGLLTRLRIPATYCWSPSLTPKPADWAPEITVSGFYFLDLESNYVPDPELQAFLAAGPPPVYIGFGSIVVDDPDGLTKLIFSAIIKSGVRALVSKGWGGLGGDALDVPEGVYLLGNCPHDWLFKHVAAVVHHGGAGTTAAGIRAGKPTVIVPFFGDQIFWGNMIARAGAGPAPIPYKKLTAEKLAAAIEFALTPDVKRRAAELGESIKAEKGADVGGKSFHEFLNVESMRCSLAPSRVAVWRVRRSKVRLSALAAAVLVKEGVLKYSDLKLYRPIEYNTEERPWDPISAVTMALVGDIGAFTMALADFPREIFKGVSRKDSNTTTGTETPSSGLSPTSTFSHKRAKSNSHLSATSSSTTLVSEPPAPRPRSSHGPATSFDELLQKIPTPHQHRSPSPRPSTPKPSSDEKEPSSSNINLDLALAAGKSAARILTAGMRFTPNVCLSLARGFRNAPRLYNDETVRPQSEKVTGLATGMKVAGKEFTLGMYDGISGLVTQPLRGAEKEGSKGLIKGIGKGIGGLILKPAAAAWSLPAYVMQGVEKEMRNYWGREGMMGIVAARIKQGEEEYGLATEGEKMDVIRRWGALGEELREFWNWRRKDRERENEGNGDGEGKRGSWFKWRRSVPATPTTSGNTEGAGESQVAAWQAVVGQSQAGTVSFPFDDDAALEKAIKESVQQTSTGNAEEDAMVEAAIRASLLEMRRVHEQQQQQQQQQAQQAITRHDDPKDHSPVITDYELRNISDEEYHALIEEAIRQSMIEHQIEQARLWSAQHTNLSPTQQSSVPPSPNPAPAYAPPITTSPPLPSHTSTSASGTTPSPPRPDPMVTVPVPVVPVPNDEDEQLRLALEQSAREHREQEERQAKERSEEEIVLEYVKRQSLAEEEFRRLREQREREEESRRSIVGPSNPAGDEEDEVLRRVLEESLRDR